MLAAPPNGYTLTGKGQGGTVGFAEGGAKVRLSDDKGGTLLRYEVDARTDSPVLWFDYDSTLPATGGYIIPAVKLEFGSLTDQRPVGRHTIISMLAEALPELGEVRDEVVAMEVERTFWEKATILHAEYHRPAAQPIGERFSRHYSDLAALWKQPAGAAALREPAQEGARETLIHYDRSSAHRTPLLCALTRCSHRTESRTEMASPSPSSR